VSTQATQAVTYILPQGVKLESHFHLCTFSYNLEPGNQPQSVSSVIAVKCPKILRSQTNNYH
jgi:hypothetical protein